MTANIKQSGQGQSGSGQNTDNNQNGNGNNSMSGNDGNSNDAKIEGWQPGQVGEVQDESQDGRLKENREAGRTLGTTDHSAKAPYAKKDEDDDSFQGGENYGQGGGSSSGDNNQSGEGSGD